MTEWQLVPGELVETPSDPALLWRAPKKELESLVERGITPVLVPSLAAFRPDGTVDPEGAAAAPGPLTAGLGEALRQLAQDRPVIGITVGQSSHAPPEYVQLRATYPSAVLAAGGFPLFLPPLEAGYDVDWLLGELDGLLLPGGADVSPTAYGEEPHPTTHTDPAVDALDFRVINWAMSKRTPVLGICRGQQVINVALGGTLMQDVPSEGFPSHKQQGERGDLHHGLKLADGTRLRQLLGTTELRVNSHHHQAVRDVAPGLRAVGWSEDGVIEALEADESLHPSLVCVQFHPEDLVPGHAPSRSLLAGFVAGLNKTA